MKAKISEIPFYKGGVFFFKLSWFLLFKKVVK
jgi:hypothetical protein